MADVISRFMEYCKVWTESDAYGKPGTPSTDRQFDLAHILVKELKDMGVENAFVDETCYVYGFVPATPGMEGLPAVGLIAHMDTSPDMSGKDVKPQILHYEGGDVVLNEELGIVMKAEGFPELANYIGEDIICTDGTTLLGADDKGGIAMIMQAVEEILAEGLPHGKICIGFTPDEEVGRGASNFDVEGFGADFAYTLDGGTIDYYEYETFNAAEARVKVKGFSIHPGDSKDRMKNAILMGMEFNGMLPAMEIPAKTEGYEGFYHLHEFNGGVEDTELVYIIRDHSMERFTERKQQILKAAEEMNRRYGEGSVVAEVRDQYYNMYEIIKDHMEVVELAEAAMLAAGVEHPTHVPIRGGTDGCQLSFKGLVCPNLPAAGHNFHGRFEYASVRELQTGVKIAKKILSPELLRKVIVKENA